MVGVADPDWGQRVVALVTGAARATTVDADAVLDHCRARLASYKKPKEVRVVTSLPAELDRQDRQEGAPRAAEPRRAVAAP